MRLEDWLKEHDLRLEVDLSCEMDPAVSDIGWMCQIGGFPDTSSEGRPAVFVLDERDRPTDIIAFAATPGDAFLEAVHMLRGRSINIIGAYGERDETLTFPPDLTV